MSKKMRRCEVAENIHKALSEANYRCGWQLATDPKCEYRPHYAITGYVGPGGVLLVQDFYDPGAAETDGVEVYARLTESPYTAATVEAIKAYGRPKPPAAEPRLGDGSHVPMPGDPGEEE